MSNSSFRFAATAFLLTASSVSAQLTSDVVPRHRLVPREEQIRRDLEDSSARLGPFRLQPLLLFRDLGYNNNVFGTPEDPVSDWTATVAAGTKWTLPFGPKTYMRGSAMPEYTWYAELAERRFLGGTYNASLLALFNRLSFEATASTQKNLSVISSEIDANALRRLNDVTFDAELDVLQRLSVFGMVQGQTHRYENEGLSTGDLARLDQLDRDERAVRAGLRYHFTSFLNFSLAAEQTESTFTRQSIERDNRSDAIVLGVHYDRSRMYANISVATREGEGSDTGAGSFPPYQTNSGSYFISYSLVAPIEVQAHGHRRVVYALFSENPYFFETRHGGSLVFRFGDRLALRAFGDAGDNDYPRVGLGGGSRPRVDDALSYGGGLAIRLFRNAALTIVVAQSEFDSNIDTFDRSVVRVQSSISFGGIPR